MEETLESILVVDDGETNRRILRALLSKAGYEVAECASGQECIDYCKQQTPDMVLLDVMMPGIDGFDTCKQLRELHSADELPIILVTARTEGEDVKQGIESGANDYVTKPIDKRVLLARVSNQLTVARSYRKIKEQQDAITRSLEMQHAIGDALQDGILVSNEAGKFVYANYLLVEYCRDYVPFTTEDLPRMIFQGRIQAAIEDICKSIREDHCFSCQRELKLPGETEQCIEFRTYPIGPCGAAAGMRLWSFRDVTEVRELEKRISQQVKMNTVSLFSVGVAHNFNNLLGSILGASEVLKKQTKENKTGQRCISVIQRAVESGRGLTDKLSTLVKHDFSNENHTPQELQLVILDVVERFSNREGSSVQFHLSIDPDLPKLWIAPSNLNDIVTNIVSNAVDAVRDGGTVWISASCDEEGQNLVLKVWDDGCGMSAEVLDRIYEPFFSTKNLDTRNGMSMVGNGLGMWNVYNLIKSVDGDILVGSAVNKGTEVCITFPINSDAATSEEQDSHVD